jgi:hypothetical protein
MKKSISAIFFCFVFSTCVYSQEAVKFLEFGKIVCGEFLALMDITFNELKNSPDSKVYVVYYGRRYATEIVRNKRTKTDVVKLKYPHREDGLNYAKAIPQYFAATASKRYQQTADSINNRIVLINGGFREDLAIEIWLVAKNGELPKPTPTLDEKNLKFNNSNPLKTPNYTYANCYGE